MTQRWRDWLAQAEHDLEQAISSTRDERHDWACFAAHQAAEKALKALRLTARRRWTMPVKSSTSSVVRWPTAEQVLAALGRWA